MENLKKDGEWIIVEYTNYALEVFIENRDLPASTDPIFDVKGKQMMAKSLLEVESYPRDYIKFVPKSDPGDIEAGRFGIEIVQNVDLEKEADKLMVKSHAGQKYGDEPYVIHPRAVRKILLDEYGDLFNTKEKLIVSCAALLHDVVEDSEVTYGEIYRKFGVAIASTVYAVTKENGTPPFHRLRNSKLGMAVKLADRIHNLRSLVGDASKQRLAKKYVKLDPRFQHELAFSTWGLDSVLAPLWLDYEKQIQAVKKDIGAI